MPSPENLALRLRRAVFNRALAEADLAAIGPLLAQKVVLVTGSDSAVIAGRKAQLLAWKREFAAVDRTIYLRTPGTITVSSVEPVAMEQGIWTGTTASGRPIASGIYSAKWRNTSPTAPHPKWVIEAEIYLTVA
jgi:hypothetical protein